MEKRVRRWWFVFTVALFLLLPVDLLTTLFTVARYGTAVETNPFMRWLLEQGIVPVALVHLVVVGVAVYSFHLLVESVQHAPDSYESSLAYGISAWLGLLIISGIILVSNNILAFV